MKILHTLVGYLAVIALPLHPFAFASPLAAIDYDGYVDTTQNHIQVDSDGTLMKHVLGTIVETCQTVTTQNYSDTIEARQLPAPVVGIIIVTVATVFVAVAWIGTDNPRREAFTQDTITKIFAQYPKYNWVICHSPYSTNFDGAEGTDWGYTHHELSISFVRTIGYDLFWAKSGTFYRYGDGGFINWAYNGNINGVDDGGATVHFSTIS